MSSTAASTHTSAASSASFLARRPVWQISYLSGLAASVIVRDVGTGRARRRHADESRRPRLAPRDTDHRRHVRDGNDGRHVLVHVRRHPDAAPMSLCPVDRLHRRPYKGGTP
jgi:hypothetical protein